MANLIKVSPEQLKERAASVRNYKQQHDEIMNRITNLVLNLCEIWEGQAQNTFVSQYNAMQPKFQKFSEQLNTYSQQMEQIANSMQNTDNTLAQRIRNIN